MIPLGQIQLFFIRKLLEIFLLGIEQCICKLVEIFVRVFDNCLQFIFFQF
jgi:hypothetical protein